VAVHRIVDVLGWCAKNLLSCARIDLKQVCEGEGRRLSFSMSKSLLDVVCAKTLLHFICGSHRDQRLRSNLFLFLPWSGLYRPPELRFSRFGEMPS
jgi:hypothetical protein